ncbi:MAG TPA: translation elongation factor Ts [Spirochaetota bacterium]|nr:translation elongation factor Ts [Spirochaetota bacterium]HOR45199.1 translation elongation factor Ts [Spirochaetota bacterium]HPK56921.1 translation elongation factor Ts [Spirochaetota bacterium]
MADITSQMIKDLRDKTQAGMLECKKALEESNGDMELATENLRKKGLAAAGKRAGRSAKEGLVVTKSKDNDRYAIMLELNCETDFVAKNDDFKKLAFEMMDIAEAAGVDCQSADKLPTSAEDKIKNAISTTGENMTVGKIAQFAVPANSFGAVSSYIHSNNKLGVLVELACESANGQKPELSALGKELAMQVAAAMPLYLDSSEVPAEVVAKEKEIYLEQMKDSGKPANVLEKIVEGKVKKYFSEVCLVDQVFIKDNAKSVTDLVKEYSTKIGEKITVKRFARIQIGA